MAALSKPQWQRTTLEMSEMENNGDIDTVSRPVRSNQLDSVRSLARAPCDQHPVARSAPAHIGSLAGMLLRCRSCVEHTRTEHAVVLAVRGVGL